MKAYLIRFGMMFRPHTPASLELLKFKIRARHSLWLTRPLPFEVDDLQAYAAMVLIRLAPSPLESRLRAVLHLYDKQERYKQEDPEMWPAAEAVILRELGATYLAEMFRYARQQLNRVAAEPEPAVAAEAPEAAP